MLLITGVSYAETNNDTQSTDNKIIKDNIQEDVSFNSRGTPIFTEDILNEELDCETDEDMNIVSEDYFENEIENINNEKEENTRANTAFNNYQRNDTINWTNNDITMNLSKFNYLGKDVCLSFTTIKEGNTLKYADAFLPPRTFKLKENNNSFTTQLIYVHYQLNSNLNKIQIILDNQNITITK